MLAAKSQTSLDFARLHVTFRPWRGITFCNENSWHAVRTFARKKVISKKPAVSKSQRKSLLFGGHCARYVQTQYGNYLFLKLPYAVQSAAPDKQQKGLKWQGLCQRVKSKLAWVLQRAQLKLAKGSERDGRGMLQSNSRAEGAND